MNLFNLLIRNIVHFKKQNLLVIAGSILCTAILTGALIVGDSISFSLNKIVEKRLGDVRYALTSGDKFFRDNLVSEIFTDDKNNATSLLHINGSVILDGGKKRLNEVNIYGINNSFDNIAGTKDVFPDIEDDQILINFHIAQKLKLKQGDEILLRFEKINALPQENPLTTAKEKTVSRRLTIKNILSDEQFGRFSLVNKQSAPNNVFISSDYLNEELELSDKANVILIVDTEIKIEELDSLLIAGWKLEDSGYHLKKNKNGKAELTSESIFIDKKVSEGIKNKNISSQNILTYFVNGIKHRDSEIPYSFISSDNAIEISKELKDDEIILNSWAANDIKGKIGSEIEIKYYTLVNNLLTEKTSSFKVKQIVNIKNQYADQTLMPQYPGLTEVESCLEWNTSLPLDMDKIRKKDEHYWEKYKGTPKAYISLNKAQSLFESRFGNLTSIRFSEADLVSVKSDLNKIISPGLWGIKFIDVKSDALNASKGSVDFSGLFIGLSFFVIIASLILISLFFILNIEERVKELGVLSSLGFNKKAIRKIYLTETAVLIFIGSVTGAVFGILYNEILITALKSIWIDIIGTSSLEVNVKFSTIITGCLTGFIISIIAVYFSVRKILKHSSHFLQRNQLKLVNQKIESKNVSLIIGVIIISFTFLIMALTLAGILDKSPVNNFLAGAVSLTGFILIISGIVKKVQTNKNTLSLSTGILIKKTISFNRKRSMFLVTLLSVGIFLVFTVGINKKITTGKDSDRSSGTGGFKYIGKSTIPIFENLNEKFELIENQNVVQIKIKEGDDASCLNLNRVTNPNLLSINTKIFSELNPFSVKSAIEDVNKENIWSELENKFSQNVIPGIANETDIIWQMGLSIGDTIVYIDQNGNDLKVKLIAGLENSILQGNVLISSKIFEEKFPLIQGSKLFLIDDKTDSDELLNGLDYNLADYGIQIDYSYEKLNEFNNIENTYLSIFLVLGGFGIIIGSFGVGIIVFRNVIDQRSHFALLLSVGFSLKKVIKLNLTTNLILVLAGILSGVLASVVASINILINSIGSVPLLFLSFILLFIILNSLLLVFSISKNQLKTSIISSLRNE